MNGTERTGHIATPDYWSCLQSVGGPSKGSQATPARSLCPPEIEHIAGKGKHRVNILFLLELQLKSLANLLGNCKTNDNALFLFLA